MNTTQTQALAPSSTHPCCRDGSGHTNALPRDDQACISDEHTVELTTEAHVRLARGSIWKRWRCIRCGSATRGEPPLRSARGTSRLQPEARRGPRARPHPHGHGPRLTDLVASGGLSPNHDLRHHHPRCPGDADGLPARHVGCERGVPSLSRSHARPGQLRTSATLPFGGSETELGSRHERTMSAARSPVRTSR